MRQILRLVHEIIISFWPQFLAACIIGGLLVIFLLLVLLRRWRSGSQPRSITQEPSTGDHRHKAADSLARLNSAHYHVFHEVFIPRLSGSNTTRLQHIVLSTHGIFVIQVQSESGLIRGGLRQTHWECINGLDAQVLTNPISRNAYHVKALAQFLDLPDILFFSVIHYDNPVTFLSPQPAHVLTSGLGRYIISHQAKLISPELLANVTDRLVAHQTSYTSSDASQAYAHARANRLREGKDPTHA